MNCCAVYTANIEDVNQDFDPEILEKYIDTLEGKKIERKEGPSSPSFYPKNQPTNIREALASLEEDYNEEKETRTILIYDNSIANRNKTWLPKILEYITTNEAVIIVGAYHYLGPEGLFTLGRKKGLIWQVYNEKGEWEKLIYNSN
jgi:uncharacterized protein YbaP (TraB family)